MLPKIGGLAVKLMGSQLSGSSTARTVLVLNHYVKVVA